MTCRCSVPLWLLFLLQSVLVCAAFGAVLAIMSQQLTTQYRVAVEEKLQLSQRAAAAKIVDMFTWYENSFEAAVDQYMNGPVKPTLLTNNSSISDMIPFYDFFYRFSYYDDFMVFVYQTLYSDYPLPNYPYNRWSFTNVDKDKVVLIHNGTGYVGLVQKPQRPPWRKFNFITIEYEVSTEPAFRHLGFGPTHWGVPGVFYDIMSARWSLTNTYFRVIETTNRYGVKFSNRHIAFSVDMKFMLPAIEFTLVSNTSTTGAVFSNDPKYRPALLTGRVSFKFFDENAPAPGADEEVKIRTMYIEEMPDKLLRNMYYKSIEECGKQEGNCTMEPLVFESEDQVACAMFATSSTFSGVLLLQYTPREFFYGEAERAMYNSVAIGIASAVVVVLSCVVIWVAIWRPLRALQHNMDLAADMHNDEVTHRASALTEIASLTFRFNAMNNKLLAARPFLPQSLLECRDADEYVDEEGDVKACETMYSTSLSADVHHDHDASFSIGSSTQHTDSKAMRTGLSILVSKRVGVLCANIRGFTSSFNNGGSSLDLPVGTYTSVLRVFETSAHNCGGIVDYFHGDRFICVFNTAKRCAAPGRAAAICSDRVRVQFSKGCLTSYPEGLSMGVAAGRALVGNLGTATMKRQCTVGSAFTEAMALQEAMRLRRTTRNESINNCALFCGRLLPDIEQNAVYEVIGVVPSIRLACGMHRNALSTFTSTANAPFAVSLLQATIQCMAASAEDLGGVLPTVEEACNNNASNNVSNNNILVAVVRSCSNAGVSGANTVVASDGEWMYQLQEMIKTNPYRPLDVALAGLLLQGTSNTAQHFLVEARQLALANSTAATEESAHIAAQTVKLEGALLQPNPTASYML